jgi:hypothetical protein
MAWPVTMELASELAPWAIRSLTESGYAATTLIQTRKGCLTKRDVVAVVVWGPRAGVDDV